VASVVPAEKIDIIRRIEQLAVGAGLAAIVQAAIKLGLPDAFDEGSASVEELAKSVEADPNTLGRLLRALAIHGVFEKAEPGRYTHNDLSRFLREDSPIPIKYLVLWMGAAWTWEAWPRLTDAIKTGKAVVPDIFGKDFYTYLAEEGALDSVDFMKAMTAITMLSAAPIVDGFDLTDVGSVADVAGGQGRLLVELMERFPHVQGTLIDLESVVENADPKLRPGGELADRSTILSGDLQVAIPVDVDLYVLKNILDSPREQSIQTLTNIKASAKPGARVVIVDAIMSASDDELRVTTIVDLFLLLNVGGARNNVDEFEQLFGDAGLKFVGVKPVPGTFPTQHLAEAIVP
jgi:C-methyltransferase